MPLPIEDYALIGDCETAALVGRDDHGRWLIGPADPAAARATSRRYRGDSLILETRFETPTGAVVVIDAMPPRTGGANLLRIVVGERGEVAMRTELVIRFGYGARIPWVTR